MYIGQPNLTGPIDAPAQRGTSNIISEGAGNENSFSLLLEMAREISNLQPPTNPSDSPIDASDDAGGLLTNLDSIGLGTTYPGASFGQLLSQAAEAQVLPGANLNPSDPESYKALQGLMLNARTQQSDCSEQGSGADVSLSSLPGVTGAFDKRGLSDWMDGHALTHPSHRCAMYCRMGMEAAGINTADRPLSGDAGDYGPFLLRHGAQTVSQDSYVPQVGDVAVFDKTSQHPFGHIQMYDGHHWVSDFVQHGFSPYIDANSAPPSTIYRFA